MQRSKRVRAVFLALSGVCAVGAVLWIYVLYLVSQVIEICGYLFWFTALFPHPLNPFAYLSVFFFVKGFTPGRRKALKISMIACTVLFGAYIAMVAFIKVDFVSALPIQIACGLMPVLAALGVMLFYGGPKWRKALCAVLASLALCASPWALGLGGDYNNRTTIGYSKSPGGTHKVVVLRTSSSGFGRDSWVSYVACPVYGLWYKQDNPEYVDPEALEKIVWIDGHTAQFNDRHNFSRTITFK